MLRGRFRLSPEDLTASAIEVWFGKIESGVAVYVNGKKLGAAGDPHSPSIYDAKSLLHAGENALAVTIACYGGAGGINRGAMLRFVQDATPSQNEWRRSVFNGLAQVLVQSTQESGAIKLTARAAGLNPASVMLTAHAVEPRPVLP